ncbi:hypothetical protein Acr_11g0006270 [Actinidia rufa]|uniref:Uncharacterized protein n=1 Tax=Actinidia rufa TaxID=165716 RepID=A0A7J0FCB6_9ERIC|nr:hypothetical protein Acr_11g0006270 [Actinidia rufa]
METISMEEGFYEKWVGVTLLQTSILEFMIVLGLCGVLVAILATVPKGECYWVGVVSESKEPYGGEEANSLRHDLAE